MAGIPSVVDLSHWQPDVDFWRMRDSGVLAVILKCTEGSTITDDSFVGHRDAAQAATLGVASYHFLRPGDAASQMDFYLGTLSPWPGERVCIDYEDATLTLADLETAVKRIIAIDPSLQIAVYSGHLIKEQLGDGYNELLAMKTSLWVAQYTDAAAPEWPTGTWPLWSLWQYTDEAQVPGCPSTGVDGNRFNGSDDNLLQWIGPAEYGPAPIPAPVPDQAQVGIMLTADRPVTITVQAGENVTLADVEIERRGHRREAT
jgi:lysozyme